MYDCSASESQSKKLFPWGWGWGGDGWVVGTLPSVVLPARVSGFWSLGLQLECRPRVVCG